MIWTFQKIQIFALHISWNTLFLKVYNRGMSLGRIIIAIARYMVTPCTVCNLLGKVRMQKKKIDYNNQFFLFISSRNTRAFLH